MESRGSAKREIKAFAGAGVRLGGYGEEEEEKRPQTTFSGLKKKELKPVIESKFRCLQCFSVNKAENPVCKKCGSNRDMSDSEIKQAEKDKQDVLNAAEDWGDISLEQLEELREDLLDLISELEL